MIMILSLLYNFLLGIHEQPPVVQTEKEVSQKSGYRFLLNNDGTNLFCREDLSLEMVERHAAECPDVITTYLVCPNCIQKMLYPSEVEELSSRGKLRELVESGVDPFGVFLNALKLRGFEVFITFRMNEVHNVHAPEEPDLCTLWREHPEYRIEPNQPLQVWMAHGLDYSYEPVRTRTVALINELLEKYKPDGIELDWMRFPRHLSGTPEAVWEKRDYLTGVMAAVRAKADEVAKSTGRRILVTARIPSSLAGCRYVGLDVADWCAKGLVDFLTLAPFLSSDFAMPIEEMRAALGQNRVPLYGCIEFGYNGQPHTESSLHAAGLGLYASGADGIYLFNFPCWREYQPHPPWAWIVPLASTDQLWHRELTFGVLNEVHRVPQVDLPVSLPCKLSASQERTIPLTLPAVLLDRRREGKATVHSTPTGVVKSINGVLVGEDGNIPIAALRAGENQIGLHNVSDEEITVSQVTIQFPEVFSWIEEIATGSEGTVFVVAPDGLDDSPGTVDKPFRTLERAQQAVREVLKQKPTENVTVFLREGTYYITKPLVFSPEDSPKGNSRVTYRAWKDEKVIIRGGVAVTGWQRFSEQLWKASIDVDKVRHLFVNGRRMPRARKQLTGEIRLTGDWEHIDGIAGFLIPDESIARWQNPQDMELGFFTVWAHMICKVASIQRGTNGDTAVFLRQPQAYLGKYKEGVQIQLPAYLENAFEALDEPGEWYFNRSEHVLYFYPSPEINMAQAEVVVPLVERLVCFEGEPGTPVRNIVFDGITFEGTTWLEPEAEGHIDVQANFTIKPDNVFARQGYLAAVHNEYTKSPGAIVLRYAHGCIFKNCTFTRFGGAGIDVELGCCDTTIYGCTFRDISGNGLQIGDVTAEYHHPKDSHMIVRNTMVLGCEVTECGAEFKGSVGIFVGYANATSILHNEIHDLPYTGISVGWGWGEEDAGGGAYEIPYRYSTSTPSGNNRIERNHIYRVMLVQTDGGGIYTLGNQPGTVIRENYIHDCGPGIPGGIYLDEGSGFIEIARNVIHDVATPINYNNHAQNRIDTCFEHDNFLEQKPEDSPEVSHIIEKAGIQGLTKKQEL